MSASTFPLPVIFVDHGGGPLPLLGQQPEIAQHLKEVSKLARQKPKAILVISAHWEENTASVLTAPKHDLLFDYGGFPPESYQYKYPCPGAVSVATRIQDLLKGANIPVRTDDKRGLDHGVFVPLMLAYPDASIPVTQLSLLSSLDPASHIALGAALRPLRSEGVLILCSGLSFHNMHAFFGRVPAEHVPLSGQFDQWLNEAMTLPENTAPSGKDGLTRRDELLLNWKKAPGALFCHPREEHLIPLMVCAGAGGEGVGRNIFSHTSSKDSLLAGDGIKMSAFLIE